MTIDSNDFSVPPDKETDLSKWPTIVKPYCKGKKQYQKLLDEHVQKLSDLQQLHAASNRYALLIIFQGMDSAGKDVMSGVNPQGCEVSSFKQPSAEALEHDFLWRAVRRLPERGRIGIFNRSYYEDVLVVRVHPEILRSQGLFGRTPRRKEHLGRALYLDRGPGEASLSQWHPHREDISPSFPEEQRKRFLERIDEQDKNWKLSLADIHERKYWKHYMEAYETSLHATSTHHAPWYVVPADDKDNARLIVSRVVLDALGALKMAYPKTTAKRHPELEVIRKQLEK